MKKYLILSLLKYGAVPSSELGPRAWRDNCQKDSYD